MEDTSELSRVVQLSHEYSKELAVLKVLYEETTFILEAPSELLTSSDERSYEALLNSYFHDTEDNKVDHFLGILSSLQDLILAPFWPTVKTFAQHTNSSASTTLRDFTNNNHYHLSLSTANHISIDEHTIEPTYDLLPRTIPNLQLPPTLPRFDASEVSFSHEDFKPSAPTLPVKTTVNGETRSHKPATNLTYPEFVHALFANVALHEEDFPCQTSPGWKA